ncbi:MAG: NifU family protein [Candidatus Abawacabacteria bacterium]|nr:NifU family protein [Candidatus Abawacabacteria bacterium]
MAVAKKKAKKTSAKKTAAPKKAKSQKKLAKKSKLTITEQVEKVLDTVRPYLISDGGNIELLGVDEKNGVVTVHLVGACASCPSSQVTLYSGVEQTLKEQVPGIVALVAV